MSKPDTSCFSREDDSVGVNTLLLKEAKGVTKKDKIVLFSLKKIYVATRVAARMLLGKKKRDRLYIGRGISFKNFLYKSVKFLRMNNSLLEVHIPKYGCQAYCRVGDSFDDFVIMTQHEGFLVERFSCKKDDVVVDVGAHIGQYTITSSSRVGPHGKVIAIEADPANFEMLNRNVKLNQFTNVLLQNCAVYSKEEKVKLFLPSQESGLTKYNTIMTNRARAEKDNFVLVNANTLDNLLEQNGISHEGVNWIKIDVEGAEYEVLKGATSILSKSKDLALLIEIHNLAGGINFYTQIVELLGSYGFRMEFEKIYEYGERHILVRKSKDIPNLGSK
jgi:FkbM family methyltransferase